MQKKKKKRKCTTIQRLSFSYILFVKLVLMLEFNQQSETMKFKGYVLDIKYGHPIR